MHTPPHTSIEHSFESQFIQESSRAAGDREHFLLILQERKTLQDASLIATADVSAKPVLFFNQHRQMVHANPAAVSLVSINSLQDGLGLRLGELLGCDHRMDGKNSDSNYSCHNCNCMPSMLTALDGKAAFEEKLLVMHPDDETDSERFRISCVPMIVGGQRFAMMTMEPLQ
ncbi:MAG: hypothetical protein JW942_02145 [Opitutales bacterium]|nr:hypothetical protein [Opitutales bacterium]